VRPAPVAEFPDPGVRLLPPFVDRVGGDRGRAPVVPGEHVVPRGGREQRQRLAQRVELELAAHPVPGKHRPAGEAAQPHRPFAGDGAAGHRVPGHEVRPVVEQSLRDEPDGPREQRVRAVGRDRQAGKALIPDPRVPVVVVAPALQPLRQRCRGGRDHRAAAGRQPAQHGVGVPGVGHRDQVAAVGNDPRPRFLRRRPVSAGIGCLIRKFTIGHFQNEVMVLSSAHFHAHPQPALCPSCPGRARPAEPGPAGPARPAVAVPGDDRRPVPPVPDVEGHRDLGGAVDRLDPAQQHGPARVGWHRERFSAFDLRVAHPAAAPYQRAVLVIAAPDTPRVGGRDRVPAGAAKEPAQQRRAVPARHAQPHHRAVRADERAALPVRNHRVLPQHPRRHRVFSHVTPPCLSRSPAATPARPALPCAV
jgi:hypothetical protein